MNRTRFLNRALGALALLALTMMAACTQDDAIDDTTAASGGDHPGVVLKLTSPSVTVTAANANASAAMSRADGENLTILTGSLYVELLDKGGNTLTGEGGKSIGGFFNSDDGSAWTALTNQGDYGFTGLYVTGGAGTYRIRAKGYISTTDYGAVQVAQVGTMTVTDGGDGTGKFALSLQPVSAAVKVVLLADNGAALASDWYGYALTGMTRCGDIRFKSEATTALSDVAYQNSSSYSRASVEATSGGWKAQTYGKMVPGTYPAKWKANSYSDDKVDDAAKTMGSTTELMKIYKSTSLFSINEETGKPGNYVNGEWQDLATDAYTAYSVKAPAGSVKLEAGKLTTLTIRLGAKDAELVGVTVSDLTEGDPIYGYVGDGYSITLAKLAAMTEDEIAALPTSWIVTDTDFSASCTWDDNNYAGGYEMLAAMMGRYYYTKSGNTKSIDLVLPNATTAIGTSAFGSYSYGLKSLTAPNVTGSIGEYAFNNCTNLATVSLPKVTGDIGQCAFENCTNLATVSLPKASGSIGNGAFYQCTSLTAVSLPKVTGNIGSNAFRECTNLTAVSLPNVMGNIGSNAFDNCTNLATVSLPKASRSIGEYAFRKCTSLTAVNLENVTGDIGQFAFENCTNLATVSLPKASGSIGNEAFYNCTNLATVSLPKASGSIGEYAFFLCTSLATVSLPKASGSIGNKAFYQCTSLTAVNLENVTGDIGSDAFFLCTSLTAVSLPKASGRIGSNAFDNCTNLTALTIGGGITAWDYYVLYGVTTENIDLILSAEQKMTTGGGGSSAATFGTATMTAEDAANKQFAGYTFKSITLQ